MRVQTQYTIDEGGDGRWYQGKIKRLYDGNKVKINYDDGDTWKGSAAYVWSMSGSPPPAQQVGMMGAGPPVVQATVVQGVAVGASVQLPNIPPSEVAVGNEPCCPVCSENKMDMAFQCGHRVCGSCLRAIHCVQDADHASDTDLQLMRAGAEAIAGARSP